MVISDGRCIVFSVRMKEVLEVGDDYVVVVDEAAFCQYAMASAASPIRFLCACIIMVD